MIERRIEANGSTPVVVEIADRDGAAELERVALRLRRAAHPGVVEVVDSGPTAAGGWRLSTAHGGGPLSSVDGLDVRRLADLVAGAATTLADLHELGIVHGRIDEHRILVGPQGRPILCDLGLDPPGLVPADDVLALGRAVASLLGRCAPIGNVIPRRGDDPHRALQDAIGAATDPDAARRPSMRRLAASLLDISTGGDRPSPSETRRIPRRSGERQVEARPARRRTVGPAPLVAVGVLLVGATVGLLQVPRSSSEATVGPPGVDEAPAATSRPTMPPGAASTPCVVIAGQGNDRADPGCPHRVTVLDRIVTIDGQGYEVGEVGDRIAVGSFACSGDATIVLLRPSTGDVFAFGQVDGNPQDVPAVATVPGAVALGALGVSERCQQLRVVDGNGESTSIDLTDLA